ncbi:MAG: type IV secretory system conjugative DNA transfer family protein [Planctomycetota bacterium]
MKAIVDRDKKRKHDRKRERFERAASQHGRAHAGTIEEVEESTLLSNHEGVFLGHLPNEGGEGQDVYAAGNYHLSVIGGPGDLKSMAIGVPTILESENSLIINDPSSELLGICRAALEAKGFDVRVLTPFPHEVSKITGREVEDAGLDLFSEFDPSMDPASIRTKLMARMQWLMPGKPDMDEKSSFFYRDGRMLGCFLGMHDIKEGRKPSLTSIRKHLMLGPHRLAELFEEAEDSPAFGGVYAELAGSLGGLLARAPQQFAGGYGICQQAVEAFDAFSAMGQHTSKEGFDPRGLTDPDKRTAVFLVSTLPMMEVCSSLTAMTLSYLFDTIAKEPGDRVTAIIDECGGLKMPQLAPSLLFYRKAGLRVAMIWQDLAAQAEKNFGKAAMKQIMSASLLKVLLGTQEPETLRMFSELCGSKAVADVAMHDRTASSERLADLGQGINHKTVPLYRPEEIRTMDRSELLVIGGNLQPLKLTKVPYWTRPGWLEQAGPSPFK